MVNQPSTSDLNVGGDVKGVIGDNSGTINQYYFSQEESEVKIKSRELIATSPYLGLEKFRLEDKDKFFGREKWINNLSDYLLKENNSVLLLLGASGSGKSSLVGAGLIPKLKNHWGAFTDLTFVPDEDPFDSLYSCLRSAEYKQSQAKIAQTIAAETLVQVVQSLKQEQPWLIFIDQFEELFTRTPKATCDVFVAGLVQLIQTYQQDGSLKIVLTMRADFLDRLSPYPDLGTIHDRHSRILTDMTDRDLKLAIEEPAARNGVVFKSGLVKHIIGDFHEQAGSLPLLQYTLDLLWKNDDITDTDRVLNQQTYTNLGGVTGALQKQADKVYNGLTEAEKEAAKQILLEVVKLDNEKPVSRRTNKATFLQDATKAAVLEKLIQARLLVSREDVEQPATVEVAHEALLKNWDVIQNLVEENREMILLRERLNADARQWQERTQSDPEKARDELWSGSKLERVLELKNDGTLKDLDSTVAAFITAGIEWSSLQLTKEQAQNKKLQLALTEATLREQSTRVLNWLPTRPLEAAVIAIQTMGLNLDQIPGSPLGSVQMGVQQAMEKVRVLAKIFQGHEDSVSSVAFAPDGQTIVSGSKDKTIRLWDLQGNAIGAPFRGHERSVMSVAFAPDGQTIVSGSLDKTIRLWDLQGNAIGTPFQGHESTVISVAFAPDGQTIVSGSADQTIRLWRGHWQAWLEVCCERLRYHPVFNTPSEVFREPTLIQMAEEACKTCRKYVWEPQAKQAELLHTSLKQGIESVQAKDYRAALQHFDRVIGAGANHPRAYHGRGYCRAHLGHKPAAIADLQRAAKLYQATGQDKPHQQVIDLLQKLQPS